MISFQTLPGLLPFLALAAACGSQTPARDEGHRAPADEVPEATLPLVEYDERTRAQWFDGKAELASYVLAYPRYGEVREGGTAVAITVSEHFDPAAMVKAERATPRTVPMMKLNLVEEFQTGIYDYDTMTSVYVPMVDRGHLRRGRVEKTTYMSQDWCGQVFQQAVHREGGFEHEVRSYFEGEGDQTERLDPPADGFWEDGLWLWARGLAGPAVEPGKTVTVPLLRSLDTSRMKHIPVAWDEARLTRGAQVGTVEVPAGRFEVLEMTVSVRRTATPRTYESAVVPEEAPERVWRFWVEAAMPHRVIRWERDDGLLASLVASDRLEYWDLKKLRHDPLRGTLGIPPKASPVPPGEASATGVSN